MIGGASSLPSIMRRFSKMPRRCSGCVAEIRRIAAEGTGTDTEPAAGRAAEGTELGVADPRCDVGKLQRALHQIAMGQAAPGVVKHAQEGCAFSLQVAMQAARRAAELLGDMLWTEATWVQAACHRLANAVQRMVRGFLPLDLLLAITLDEMDRCGSAWGRGRASVAAEIVIELTCWSNKMRDPRCLSYSEMSAGCRCMRPTETGRQWLPTAS